MEEKTREKVNRVAVVMKVGEELGYHTQIESRKEYHQDMLQQWW